jgi:hypothetical protein
MNNKFADEKFIWNVENYTGNSLILKEDIERLIRIVIEKRKEEEFEKLTFTSKYVCGLMRIIKNEANVPVVNSIEHIKEDLNENIKKAIEQMKEIISGSDKENNEHFKQKYLSVTTQSFNNLYLLFADLEAVKKYINYLKRLA